jgi:hypothetical protein
MERKICKKCGKEKNVCEFYSDKTTKDGKRGSCKLCMSLYDKNWKINNPNKVLELSRKYNSENKELVNIKTRKWREKNKTSEIIRNREWKKLNNEKIKESTKKWREKNKENIKEYKKNYEKLKIKTDILYKLKKTLRNTILRYLKNKRFTTTEIIGCDYDSFKIYFESLFTEGMCWDKLGSEIHIDHIIPLSSAKTEDELYKLNHYTNLQPLWVKDNLIKGSKLL